jgi:hypothetical protein
VNLPEEAKLESSLAQWRGATDSANTARALDRNPSKPQGAGFPSEDKNRIRVVAMMPPRKHRCGDLGTVAQPVQILLSSEC